MQNRKDETLGNRLHDVIRLLELAHFSSEIEARFVIRVARHALVPILDELNHQELHKISEDFREQLTETAKETMRQMGWSEAEILRQTQPLN